MYTIVIMSVLHKTGCEVYAGYDYRENSHDKPKTELLKAVPKRRPDSWMHCASAALAFFESHVKATSRESVCPQALNLEPRSSESEKT